MKRAGTYVRAPCGLRLVFLFGRLFRCGQGGGGIPVERERGQNEAWWHVRTCPLRVAARVCMPFGACFTSAHCSAGGRSSRYVTRGRAATRCSASWPALGGARGAQGARAARGGRDALASSRRRAPQGGGMGGARRGARGAWRAGAGAGGVMGPQCAKCEAAPPTARLLALARRRLPGPCCGHPNSGRGAGTGAPPAPIRRASACRSAPERSRTTPLQQHTRHSPTAADSSSKLGLCTRPQNSAVYVLFGGRRVVEQGASLGSSAQAQASRPPGLGLGAVLWRMRTR